MRVVSRILANAATKRLTGGQQQGLTVSTLFHELQRHGREQAERPALWLHRSDGSYGGTSYGELAATARRFTAAFLAHLPAGQIIPMCLAKSPSCIAALFGA